MVETTSDTDQDASDKVAGLLRAYTAGEPAARARDLVGGRYRIILTQALPELGSRFATAYVANDTVDPDATVYALVFEQSAPLRTRNIAILKEFRHPNLLSVMDDEVVYISTFNEARYVVILERPQGQSLSTLLAQGKNPVSEAILINYFLRPLTEILVRFFRSGISHNRINLNTVYLYNNTVMLGECISEPSGFSQDYRFEPIERAMTSPIAKPDYAISADCYALAVLMLHLSLGYQPFARMDRETFIDTLLARGSYHVLALEWDFSENMQDFFRGLLNDMRRERWDPESIDNWIAGRRFNLIMPSPPRETARGFEWQGVSYFNRKALANALFRRFDEARIVLFDGKLPRWLETSVHKPEQAESIARLLMNSRGDNIRNEAHNNELLARMLIVLDPTAPIRLKDQAAAPEAVGMLLANAFLNGEQERTALIVQMLESDLPWFWLEQQNAGHDYANVTLKLQKLRGNLKMRGFGFGIERCVYDFLPELACQSPLVKALHITTIKELLRSLDSIAKQKLSTDNRITDFIDRHIAAFIASKLELGKEIRITELDALPKLVEHPALIGLKLLMRAQAKTDNESLKGLCYWITLRLMPLTTQIHKKSLRERFQKDLSNAAASGQLKTLNDLMCNPDIFVSDYQSYQQAGAMYRIRKEQINDLKNNTLLTRHSQIAGRGIAQTLAYGITLSIMYYTLKYYFHF